MSVDDDEESTAASSFIQDALPPLLGRRCMSLIELRVYGLPAPQGSKRHVGGGVMVESSKALKPWREAVKTAAREAAERQGFLQIPRSTPVYMDVTFIFPRPASHYGTGRNAGVLKPNAPRWKTTAPDLSKLVRATEDAITDAGLWADDALVVMGRTYKIYGDQPGALITLGTL